MGSKPVGFQNTANATLVSRKVLAEKLGVSERYVGILIKQGKITETTAGIDLDRAIGEYQRNTDATRRAAQRQRAALKVLENPKPIPTAVPAQGVLDLNDAKRRREHYAAEQLRLNVAERKGELLPREVVSAKQFAALSKIRDRLLSLPARLVNSVLPDAMADIEREVRDLCKEIEDDLSELNNS